MGHTDAVVDRHPVLAALLFLLPFLVHDFVELSRGILGVPPESAIVRRRGVPESESDSSRPKSHFE